MSVTEESTAPGRKDARLLQRQIDRLQRRIDWFRARADGVSRARLILFVLLLLGGAAVLLTLGPLPWAIISLLLVAAFIFAVRRHRQLERSILLLHHWQQIKRHQLARLGLDWPSIPAPMRDWPDSEHPFAWDLNLVGERGLHRLLDNTTTVGGSRRLLDWLAATDLDPERSLARQALAQELAGWSRFRGRLTLRSLQAAGSRNDASPSEERSVMSMRRWPGQRMLDWLSRDESGGPSVNAYRALLILAPLNLLLLFAWVAALLPPVWILSWLVYAALTLGQGSRVRPLFADAAFLADGLRRLDAVFRFLESAGTSRRPALGDLLADFQTGSKRPSHHIARANRILALAGLRYNPLVSFLINALAPVDIFAALRLMRLKEELRDRLPRWLDRWYDLEALCALAEYSAFNPDSIFPELDARPLQPRRPVLAKNAQQDQPAYIATNLAHPLIPAHERVGNDYTIDQLGSLTIITGSNMAGKSSFLRTLGVSVCLAWAGGPVLADRMQLVPFRLMASITVTDSLADGFSFFYAEVRRLKRLLDAYEQPHRWPLLFLIDEIFRGTNNRERLIGSQAYVRELVGGFGAGAIATHDLELAGLAEEIAEVRNVHFRDEVRDGRMIFDYKLHPGPCPTTNALEIMRQAGLPLS